MSMQQHTLSWREQLDRLAYHSKKLFKLIPAVPHAELGGKIDPDRHRATFRVWAPHAESVFVVGDFNRWSPWATPLHREADGTWSTETKASPGDNYKFLIHPQQENTPPLYRTDPYALAVNGPASNARLVVDEFDWGDDDPTQEAFHLPGWHELVIYELHVGTFEERPSTTVGQFSGVIEKLPYLRDLGINAIELMPVAGFPGDYSWGYNIAHPFAITEAYGGRTALKQLIKAAHQHGIAVIIDVVYNHFGPQDLSLWQFDGWHHDGKGGIYFYNDWRSKTPWGDTRPDYGRAEVRQFIADNVTMWFDEFRVDGLRWDATSYIRNAHGHDGDRGADIAEGWNLMKDINADHDAQEPWKLMIAEDLQNNAWLTKPPSDNGAGFDTQWDASFVHPLRQAIITPQDEDRDMAAVATAISGRYNGDPIQRVIYTESHDEVANGKSRVPEEISPGEADSFFAKKRATLGAAIVFTAPGIPMIFQGQEFLEDGWFDDHDPLDWPKSIRHIGIVALYQDLIRLRRNLDGLTRGLTGPHVNVHHVNHIEKIIAYHRWQDGGPGDDVIVVANFSHRAYEGYGIGLPHPGRWQVRFNSDDHRYDGDFENTLCPAVVAAGFPKQHAPFDGLPCWGNVVLAPYSVLILSQEPESV